MELTDRFKATLINILGVFLFAAAPWIIPEHSLGISAQVTALASLIFPIVAFYHTRKTYPDVFRQSLLSTLLASVFILPVVALNLMMAM